ncbi:hypothetical protein CRYUN_Cryun37aG0016700 [Craigia yunnanensis]
MLMGAHIARLVRTPNSSLVLALVSLLSLAVVSFGDTDTEILLTFKDSLANPSALSNWNASIHPCHGDRANWIGVLCLKDKIWGLQLENMGLAGLVNIEILDTLHTISLMNNNFGGTMPDLRKLGALKALYLSNNRFTGQIPDDAFKGMRSLKRVFLAYNAFTGKIPSSLMTLPKLLILRLEENQFSGQIPDFNPKVVKLVNLANNQLEGPIPASLRKMGASMFSSLLLAVIAALIFILSSRKQKSKVIEETDLDDSNKLPTYDEGEKVSDSGGMMKRSELIILKDDIERFDLHDLLRASAEVLGSGNFGAPYKAVIMNNETVVVKRYKQMNDVGREDFHEHMRRLGRLNHQNLQPVVGYYYRKEEKLLVSKFMEDGSLASHLQANHTLDKPGLDSLTRLKIIMGVSRGLNYLYNELPSLVVPLVI